METFYQWCVGSLLMAMTFVIAWQAISAWMLDRRVKRLVKEETDKMSSAIRVVNSTMLLHLATAYNDANDPKRSLFLINSIINIDTTGDIETTKNLIIANKEILMNDRNYILGDKSLRTRFMALIYKQEYSKDERIDELISFFEGRCFV